MSLLFALKGRPGEPGDKGDEGDKGDKGDKGDTGEAGALTLVDRGDPDANDFSVGNFTGDNTWRDLDLSTIVPDGVIAVKLYVSITSSQNNQGIYFRKKGNTHSINIDGVFIGVIAGLDLHSVIVFCDADRKIQYNATTALSAINVTVCGWFL